MKITSEQLKQLSKEDEVLKYTYISERIKFGNATTEKEQELARELFLSFSQSAFSIHYEFSTGKRKLFTKVNEDTYYYEDHENNTLTIIKEGIGCVYAHLLGTKNSSYAYRLECLEVIEDQRGKGYGKELLKLFLDLAKEKDVIGISTVAVNQYEGWRTYADSLDRLQVFYEGLGFRREEWRRMFYVYQGKEGQFQELQELNKIYEDLIGYTTEDIKDLIINEKKVREMAKEDRMKRKKLEEEKRKQKAKKKAAKKQKRKRG